MSQPIKIHVESIADEVEILANAMKQLNNSRLSDRMILLLLKDATGLRMGDIKKVLKALPNLSKWYLK